MTVPQELALQCGKDSIGYVVMVYFRQIWALAEPDKSHETT